MLHINSKPGAPLPATFSKTKKPEVAMHIVRTCTAIGRGRHVHHRDAACLMDHKLFLSTTNIRALHITRHSQHEEQTSPQAPRTQRARTQSAASEIAALSRTAAASVGGGTQSSRRPPTPLARRLIVDDSSRSTPSTTSRRPPANRNSRSSRRDAAPTAANPSSRRPGAGRFSSDSSTSFTRDDNDPFEPRNILPGTLLEEQFADQFTVSPHDIAGHADVITATDHAHEDVSLALSALKHARSRNDRVAVVAAEQQLTTADESITHALEILRSTKEKVYPVHEPGEINLSLFYKSTVGNLPTGPGGQGNLVEPGLRFLAGREGHTWQETRALAERVVRGEFVKFTSRTERREVEIMLKQMVESRKESKGGKGGKEGVKFEVLDLEARDLVAERLVAGKVDGAGFGAIDPNKQLESAAERHAATLVEGRWPAMARGIMMQTMKEHLPSPGSASGSAGGATTAKGQQKQKQRQGQRQKQT